MASSGDEDATRRAVIPQFIITRTVDAPRAAVWQLWTDPEELSYWFHPGGMSTPRDSISVDLRVGGRYRYTMVDDETGERHPIGGVYLDVSEPERLVFTWGDPGEQAAEAPVITVTLADRGEQTELSLHVRGLAGRPGARGAYDGWDEALSALVDRRATR